MDTLTTVFRVEDSEGYGPYQGAQAQKCSWYDEMGYCHRSHPMPVEDGIQFDFRRHESCRHGFSSMEKLEAWFGDWLFEVLASGFRIALYHVEPNDVLHGKKQVVFYPSGVRSKG